MSGIHVRDKDPKNKMVNCIFHYTVPSTLNEVGNAWSEVIQKARNPVPLMADNDSAENANITAGSILEIAETVRFSSTNLSNAARLAEIEATYSAKQSEIFNKLVAELDFFGKEI